MVNKIVKGFCFLGIGILLVYFIKDPLIALLVGLVIIAIVEVIENKLIRK